MEFSVAMSSSPLIAGTALPPPESRARAPSTLQKRAANCCAASGSLALLFTDMAVDPSTGAVSLRALFPNADRGLLPGMYARVQLTQAVNEKAVTVPQVGGHIASQKGGVSRTSMGV